MSADMDKASPDYRAFLGVWIPAEVWLSDDLTLQEKVMLVEINSLQHPERGCFKSNRALGEFFQLSVSRVSEIVSALASKGHIRIETITSGRQLVERRIFMTTPLRETEAPPSGKAKPPFGKGEAPPSGKAKVSNTSMSNTDEEDLAPTVHRHLAAPKRPVVPIAEIVAAYHELLPMCPQVRKLTAAREAQIKARWRCGDLPDLKTWRDYFAFVSDSKFLTGRSTPEPGRQVFVADLEWLVKEANYVKVYERKYHK